MKNLLQNRKTLYLVFSLVLISVFTLSIAYAVLSVTLNIQGNAEVVASSWDIHLDNVKVTSGSASGIDPSITSPTTATFSTTLNMPGDFYEFTIDVVNDGSIDAMIDGVSKIPTLTETQAKYLNYIVEYQNGESINTKQLVSKNSFVRLKVRVEFRKDITASDLPTTSETLNLAFVVNYVQSDGIGSSVTDNGVYDPYKIGNEKCFGTECFYVISSTDSTVTMLAKYNLYVGGVYDGSSWVAYGSEATGIQDLTMLGDVSGQSIKNGTTSFSYSGNSYSGSIVEEYVNNYKNKLKENFGVEVEEARLITYEELCALGCNYGGGQPLYSCKNAPGWVYATTYWSGSSINSNDIYYVSGSSYFSSAFYGFDKRIGVRPVITISKDYL